MTARVRFLPVLGEGFRQARIAYNAAEYSRALETVEAISSATPLVLALRAKILRRLNRIEEAIEAVRAAISISEQEEDRRSALAVLASIQATTGALDSAFATLVSISGPAADWSVETSSEVGFWQAWIAYCRGNLDLAEEQIVKAYADSHPFYHARAVQLQAFIFGARGAYQEQCDLLIRALREMRDAPQEEIEIGMRAQVLYSLSGIAHDISNEIDPSELRAELYAIPWTPYLNEQRYWSYRAIGLRMAQEGGLGVSIGLGLLRRSAEYASTPSRRALSTLDSSDVAFSVNEPHNGRSLLDDADEIASTVDWSKERGDHRFALLRASMLFARQERVDRARHYLTIYRNLPPMEAMTAFSHDDRLEGMRAHAEGITARMTGEKNEAVDFLSHAFSLLSG